MRNKTIARIQIDVDYSAPLVTAAKRTSSSEVPLDAPDFLEELASNAIEVLRSHGFRKSVASDTTISELNGGYSLYIVYVWQDSTNSIKLVVDLRLADHKAKPNYKEGTAMRQDLLDHKVDNILSKYGQEFEADTAVLDVAYQSRDWGVQIFVGGKDSYSKPVDTISAAMRIFEGRVAKLVSKYTE